MNSHEQRIPPRTWVILVVALVWLSVVIAIRHFRPIRAPGIGAEVAALRLELGSRPADLERQLADWRKTHPSELGGGVSTKAETALDASWVATTSPDAVTFRPAGPATARWADVVGAVERLERQPGLIVQEVRIDTTGSRTVRLFSAIEITVHIDASLRPLNPVRRAEEPHSGPGSERELAGLRETGTDPLAVRPPAPSATPAAGSVSRPGIASGPATLAPAPERFIPEPPKTNPLKPW